VGRGAQRIEVEPGELVGRDTAERVELAEARLQLGAERRVLRDRRGRTQVPEQLVQPAQRIERPVHGGSLRPPAVRLLHQALSGAEAVERRAAAEAALAQLRMDRAAEAAVEVRAGRAGWFVDREVGRDRERGRDAAEPRAARAVGGQLPRHVAGYRSVAATI